MLIVSTPKTEMQLFSGSVWSSDVGAACSLQSGTPLVSLGSSALLSLASLQKPSLYRK